MLKNRVRLFFFKEKIFYWKLLNVFKIKNVSCIDRVLISFNVRNIKELENNIIVNFFYFLEVISSQKVFLKRFVKGNIKTKIKNINLTGQVVLRNLKAYNFLDFLNFFILPNLKKNFVKINTKVDPIGNLSISIKDLSLVPGLTEQLNNETMYPIKIDIIFKSGNIEKGKYFLKELGL
jgi:ribosomal protein L5